MLDNLNWDTGTKDEMYDRFDDAKLKLSGIRYHTRRCRMSFNVKGRNKHNRTTAKEGVQQQWFVSSMSSCGNNWVAEMADGEAEFLTACCQL